MSREITINIGTSPEGAELLESSPQPAPLERLQEGYAELPVPSEGQAVGTTAVARGAAVLPVPSLGEAAGATAAEKGEGDPPIPQALDTLGLAGVEAVPVPDGAVAGEAVASAGSAVPSPLALDELESLASPANKARPKSRARKKSASKKAARKSK